MKILVISDLHLCDTRNGADFEARRLEKLAEFIRACAPDAVPRSPRRCGCRTGEGPK